MYNSLENSVMAMLRPELDMQQTTLEETISPTDLTAQTRLHPAILTQMDVR